MKIKVINKDAQISITVGTAFIAQMQGLLLSLLSDKSEEDIASFKESLELLNNEDEEFPEDWMRHVHLITSLLKDIEEIAEQTNQIIEKDVDDIITESES